VCLFAGWLSATAAFGLACGTPVPPSAGDVVLRVGFGLGGTALTTALPVVIDALSSEPLVTIGWNGRPLPKLASDWQWTEDGRTLRLKLRPGVVFHDGSPVTAEGVASDLRRHLGEAGYSRVTSIVAHGPDQVLFSLRQPDAFLLAELFKTTIKTGKDRTLGTGPFVIRNREPEAVLEAFAQYHLGKPSISRVVVRPYETPRGAWAALMRGDVDFLYEVNRDAVEFVKAGSQIRTFSFPRPYYIPLIFNLKHPILARREVRRAINEAIDREAIVQKALNGQGQPADGPVWPFHWAYHSGDRSYVYNPAAARVRLDAAGVPVRPSSGGMPKRFTFRCLFWSDDPQFERIALVLQRQLFEIGIDVEMVPISLTAVQQRLGTGEFDAVLVPMGSGRSLDWTYLFWRSGPNAVVRSGYTAADVVLDRLRSSRSDDETRMAVADLQRILYEDPPAAFLVRPETARAVADSFLVADEERGRDIAGSLWQWKPRANGEARAGR
jgi:peptide/nickel transport system substrate-binding protein